MANEAKDCKTFINWSDGSRIPIEDYMKAFNSGKAIPISINRKTEGGHKLSENLNLSTVAV